MSMIGLFTATPRVAATGAGGDDAAAAEGFGSALQEVLDGLVADTGQGEAGHPGPVLAEGAADADAEPEAISLVEAAQPAVTDGFAGVVVTVTPTGGPIEVELPVQAGVTVVDGEPQEHGQGADADVMPSPMPAAELVDGELPELPNTDSIAEAVETTVEGNVAETSEAPGAPVLDAPLPEAHDGEAEPGPAATVPASPGAPQPEAAAPVVHAPAPDTSAAATEVPVAAATAPANAATSAPAAQQPAQAPTSSVPSAAASSGPAAPTQSGATTSTAPAVAPTVDAPQATAPLATAAPANAATPVVPTAAAAPAAPTASVPFTTQLARPIFSLSAAGTGEHVMTVSVTPDELGPVTVRAHVGAEGVRVELFAPTDHARDAIRAILPDLRRDLAGAGLGGNLNLSSQSEPGAQNPDGQGGTSTGPGTDAAPGASGDSTRDGSTTPEPGQQRRSPYGTTSTIDILA